MSSLRYFLQWIFLATIVSLFIIFITPFLYIPSIMMFGVFRNNITFGLASIPFALFVSSFIAMAQKEYSLPQRHNYVWHDWVSKSVITSVVGAFLSTLIVYYWIPVDHESFMAGLDVRIVGGIMGIVIGISFGQFWVLRRIFRYSWLWVVAHVVLGLGIFNPSNEYSFLISFLSPIAIAPVTGIAMLSLIHLNHLSLDETEPQKEKSIA